MRVLQINTSDKRGGAARCVNNLHIYFRRKNIQVYSAFGQKFNNDKYFLQIPNEKYKPLFSRILLNVCEQLKILNRYISGTWRLSQLLTYLAEPHRQLDIWRGIEDFRYPGIWNIFEWLSEKPDIINCHNLHGKYFDLRALPWLSQQFPLFLTLHDAWMLSGHCAHSFDCGRWKTNCSKCPDLSIPPAIKRDAATINWMRKRNIYRRSRLYISTPSRWLMEKVKQSILMEGTAELRIIPHGVDLTVFHPFNKEEARKILNIPTRTKVLLFAANGIRNKIWKDYKLMRRTVSKVAELFPQEKILFIALGEKAPDEKVGSAVVQFIPYQENIETVARYYQSADIYLHGARIDNFPNAVLEALACGAPVVATAVGGIPEQIKGFSCSGLNIDANLNKKSIKDATGFLIPPGDAEAMSLAVQKIFSNNETQAQLGVNAVRDVKIRFNMEHSADEYIKWYSEVLDRDSHFFNLHNNLIK